MDTQQLQAFDQIVRHGSFSKAARMLNVSQPAISVRIQTLEQEVGGSLFIRGGSRLELTELGASFLPYAQQALLILSTGVENAQLVGKGEAGRLTIGTLPSLATGFFASTLARLRTMHPRVGIYVHTGHSQQIEEMLRDGIVKLGFMVGRFVAPDMTAILHLQEPLIVVAATSHPLAQREALTSVELGQAPFFQVDWCSDAKRWYTQLGVQRGMEIEIPPQSALDLLLRGQGAALLTTTLVEPELQAGRLVKLPVSDLPQLFRESVLVCLNRQEQLPVVVQEFLRVFREEAREYRML